MIDCCTTDPPPRPRSTSYRRTSRRLVSSRSSSIADGVAPSRRSRRPADPPALSPRVPACNATREAGRCPPGSSPSSSEGDRGLGTRVFSATYEAPRKSRADPGSHAAPRSQLKAPAMREARKRGIRLRTREQIFLTLPRTPWRMAKNVGRGQRCSSMSVSPAATARVSRRPPGQRTSRRSMAAPSAMPKWSGAVPCDSFVVDADPKRCAAVVPSL